VSQKGTYKRKTKHNKLWFFLSFIFLDLLLSLHKGLATATTSGESCEEKASSVVVDGLLVHGWKERKTVCDSWQLVEFVVIDGGDANWCINCRWVRAITILSFSLDSVYYGLEE
jgi:hypothetical protein